MKKLWKFEWYCGRMGDLSAVFLATQEQVNSVMGKEVYFGEALGKHSEVQGVVKETDITMITDNPDAIKALDDAFDGDTIAGYNPLDYFEEEDD